MSILAVGRRNVLFPPPGVKIRRTLETQFLTDEPTMIAEHDPKRVLLSVSGDANNANFVAFAGNKEGLGTAVYIYLYYVEAFTLWGGEEVWAKVFEGGSPNTVNILIQSVFYD